MTVCYQCYHVLSCVIIMVDVSLGTLSIPSVTVLSCVIMCYHVLSCVIVCYCYRVVSVISCIIVCYHVLSCVISVMMCYRVLSMSSCVIVCYCYRVVLLSCVAHAHDNTR